MILWTLHSQLVHWVKKVQPRIGVVYYPFVRAGAMYFYECTTAVLIVDMCEGKVDVAYVTYMGYMK
jgi:hypothetical protein